MSGWQGLRLCFCLTPDFFCLTPWLLIDAVSRSYPVRREDSNDFIIIQICSWRQYQFYFYFWCVFLFQDTYWPSKFCERDMEMSLSEKLEFEKLDFKYRKVLLDIDFLNTCLKNNVIPKFVQFCVFKKDLRISTAYRHCQIKLLKQEISNKKRNLRTLRRDLT